jgi:hypothetical protein
MEKSFRFAYEFGKLSTTYKYASQAQTIKFCVRYALLSYSKITKKFVRIFESIFHCVVPYCHRFFCLLLFLFDR